MKNILFISLFAFSVFIKGQDSAYCYNSGNIALPSENLSIPFSANKQFHSLILMAYVMDQKEVMGFLNEKNNSVLKKLITKVKLAKNLRFVSLAAIPAGIIGAVSIANENYSSQNLGFGLIGLSAVSISSGIYFNYERKKNYKKAIAKYNQLYN